MDYATVTVRLGGSLLHVVTNKLVSVPEIVILRQIHGNDAVLDIKPAAAPEIFDEAGGEIDYSDEFERERLVRTYEAFAPEEMHGLVERMFPPMHALPSTLRHIGHDSKKIAGKMREDAERLLANAAALDGAEDADLAAALDTETKAPKTKKAA